MSRFVPKSLIGQIALVMALALLVAQAINFGLIYTERQRFSRSQLEGPAIARFVSFAQSVATEPTPEANQLGSLRVRHGRYAVSSQSSVQATELDPALTERLRDHASSSGLAVRDVRAASVEEVAIPPRLRTRLEPDEEARMDMRLKRLRTIILSVHLPDGRWVNARVVTPRPTPWLILRPLIATLLTYLIVLGAMIWIAARLVRPLRDLTAAAERVRGGGEPPQVEPRGPADLSRAILAFNAMSARVSAMLDEKDRMLGAIGHDLRTPLASLRIRAETVEPDEERQRMIATIEEMTLMLDDTLALARSGRAVETPRMVDVTALADTVVEEFRALGHEAEMEDSARHTAWIQPTLIRRAVRNLVANGVKYGNSARVAVRESGDMVAIEVADTGPGVPEAELAQVQEAFYRVEASRSRETGGSGLGLTLARAAAQAHGGNLELTNRPEGGLLARITLPKGKPAEA